MVARETNLVNAFETTLAAQLASGGSSINLTDDQFEQLKEYVVDSCEDIMDRSLEWADSDLSNEIIDNNEIIFEFRSILEGVA